MKNTHDEYIDALCRLVEYKHFGKRELTTREKSILSNRQPYVAKTKYYSKEEKEQLFVEYGVWFKTYADKLREQQKEADNEKRFSSNFKVSISY